MAGGAAQPALVGPKVGRYRIAEKIGEGSMGEVYRARDDRLDRNVAIKLLRSGVLSDETVRRHFRGEAIALSKLNHPNIETIFDFDSDQGRDFIVAEYIPGEGLDQKLASGALPEKDILDLGSQLADGLGAAHDQKIVHRDLKPSNLRITPEGRLKILDFGVAKLATPVSYDASTASLTESTRFAGTLPYMAPEQVRGDELDARTDIWAAGAVLYAMATGHRPFSAQGLQVTDQILHQSPAAPSSTNQQISLALNRIVLKCLDKDPERRYQSTKELVVDLRRVEADTAGGSEPATGRSKWRPAKLAGVGVGIFAFLAVFVLALNILGWRQHILERTAVPRIESLAVLPLANLSDDPQQEYFADGMTEELITTLGKAAPLRVISYIVLMANQWLSPGEAIPQAKAAALKALSIDETLAEAHTSVASVMELDWEWANADKEYQRALELNSNYATAHLWYSVFLSEMGRYTDAMAQARRSVELDPLSLIAKTVIGQTQYMARRYAEAQESLSSVIEIDPQFWPAQYCAGTAFARNGQFREGIAALKAAAALSPRDEMVLSALAYAYGRAGKKTQAQKILDGLSSLSHQRYVSAYLLAVGYVGVGENDKALRSLEKAYQERDISMVSIGTEPMLDPLRSDQRFQTLLRRMNLSQRTGPF